MAAACSLAYIILPFLLCFYNSLTIATTPPSNPHALLFIVTKDPSTNQYTTEIKQRTPLVPIKLTIDLGGDTLWVDCDKGFYISSTYKPVYCSSPLCKLLQTPFACGSECYGHPRPGCYNNTCSKFLDNTVVQLSTLGEVAKDVVSIQSTDGSNPGKDVVFPRFAFTCGATFLLKGLANGVKGIAGFSKSLIGIPSQLSHAFRLPRIFSICLGSSTGFAIIGGGPYNVLPGIDLSQLVTYTPLISNPIDGRSFAGNNPANDYYIKVTGFIVNNKKVPVNSTLLKLNKEGNGGTKISTVAPYTVLEHSIYNAVTNAFVNSISKVPRVKAVAPFKICYNSSSLGSTIVGPGVPPIQLVLHNQNVTWFLLGANSMVLVKNDVYCLGFLDGGLNPQTSIVIGGYQLQNAFLQFDLARSRLGFVSTILGRRTTCANFNFTSNV